MEKCVQTFAGSSFLKVSKNCFFVFYDGKWRVYWLWTAVWTKKLFEDATNKKIIGGLNNNEDNC